MAIAYKDFNILSKDQVYHLYEEAGWTNYTKDINKVLFGIQNSAFVYTAWDGRLLIGLVRVVSDNYTIAYIQDLLVLKKYQHLGIGKNLVEEVKKKYHHVRQIVLLTDKEGPLPFYESLGFQEVSKNDCLSYICINNTKN
ncbi:MAG: GNAT family N-acetyltransferase [Tenericutes bacterium]|jgi:GNAT superfamily N-acetyltransferase|nr:GNAT family N-acetyltransferase [Mycoplasmatota bacterium]